MCTDRRIKHRIVYTVGTECWITTTGEFPHRKIKEEMLRQRLPLTVLVHTQGKELLVAFSYKQLINLNHETLPADLIQTTITGSGKKFTATYKVNDTLYDYGELMWNRTEHLYKCGTTPLLTLTTTTENHTYTTHINRQNKTMKEFKKDLQKFTDKIWK